MKDHSCILSIDVNMSISDISDIYSECCRPVFIVARSHSRRGAQPTAHNDAYDDETRQGMWDLIERTHDDGALRLGRVFVALSCRPTPARTRRRAQYRRRQNDCAWRRRHICGRSVRLLPVRFTPEPQYSESDARSSELQRSMPTAMLRPVNSAKVVVCANSFANVSSFANASCTFPYASQLE